MASRFLREAGTGKTLSSSPHGRTQGVAPILFHPDSRDGILSKPDFIGFWTDQRWHHSNKKFVVILEDSDAR